MFFLASLSRNIYLKLMEDSVSGYFCLYFVSDLRIPLAVTNVNVPRTGAVAYPSSDLPTTHGRMPGVELN